MARELHAVVAGGSIGGLAAALALRGIGARVPVFERSAGRIQARGAGVVMQPEVEYLLERLGSSAAAVSVPLRRRQRIDRQGKIRAYDAPQLMTSWDALYRVLHHALPADTYHPGSKLVETAEEGDSVVSRFADGRAVTCDLVIGADGIGSAARVSAGIPGAARYAGYVAWRGLEPESSISERVLLTLRDAFTMYAVAGLQFLTYLVPGPNGETEPGRRRVNWVWYMNVTPETLPHALASRDGTRYRTLLPPGQLLRTTRLSLLESARQHLPTVLADLVGASNVFMQPVHDLPLTRMRAGRVALLGDAAGTVRPHTASGTSKAVGDALSLAHALKDWDPATPLPVEQLGVWERERGRHLRTVAAAGTQLAERSALGIPHAPQFLKDL
ncbi:fad-dependent monooxygenase [Streptomyces sp. SPB074]|nr:fad-dependent monooxygenase [Streptomyces sp. SPB074]